ncbi:MAG: hypothetical protein PVI91_09270, partial [Gammaproteobacteria bacterium]
PAGISATGISAVPTRKASQTTGYSVNFTRVADFESLRPLVSDCSDFGALEHFRDRMEATTNLEEMRDSLTEVGFGMFDDCPAGVSGPGITPVK